MSAEATPAISANDELSALIKTFGDTQQRILELTGGTVDAVVQPSGVSYLLPQAQASLRHTASVQRQFAAERGVILDALPAHIALLDRAGGIVTVNKGWRLFSGDNALSGANFTIGANYIELCDRISGDCPQEAVAIAAGIRSILQGDAAEFAIEYPCHTPAERRWFRLMATPLADGAGQGAVVMHIDITERKLAEARTEEIGRSLETLVREAKVGILVHRGFAPLMANDELAMIFGMTAAAEILEIADCRDLYADDERERISAIGKVRMEGGPAPKVYAVKGKKRDGSLVELESRSFAIQWGGQLAVCAMITDVTHQRHMEESYRQSQRLESLGQLTGGIAHDFNNLLTVILGNAEMLMEDFGADKNLRAQLEMMKIAAERGADLTHRLLAFARKQPLDSKTTDVGKLLTHMDDMLRRTLGEHIEINLIRGKGLWQAMVDGPQLESAVLNLCINARDAMPKGGRLTIEMANAALDQDYADENAEASAGDYVMVAVSDTGTGMPPETVARAFDPFFTTKEIGKGTGLGLSMVHGFVRQSKGHVKIYSETGHGTAIKLYLPRAAAGAVGGEAIEAPDALPRGYEKILLVEDDAQVRVHVCAQLEALGYRVVTAGSGPEAVKALGEADDFELLFTDMVMPGGMSGAQLADEAHKRMPGLPILFSSGYTENAMAGPDRRDPRIHLLSKPYRRRELAAKLRQALASGTAAR